MKTFHPLLPLVPADNWEILPGDFMIVAANQSKTTTAFLRRMAAISLNYEQSTLLVSRHCADQEEKHIHDLAAIDRCPEYLSTGVSLRVKDCGMFSSIDCLLAVLAEDVADHDTRLVLIDSPELLLSRGARQAQHELGRLKLFCLRHSVAMIATAKTLNKVYEDLETRRTLLNPELRRVADLEFLLVVMDVFAVHETIQLHCVDSYRTHPKPESFGFITQTGELWCNPTNPHSLTNPADSLLEPDFSFFE